MDSLYETLLLLASRFTLVKYLFPIIGLGARLIDLKALLILFLDEFLSYSIAYFCLKCLLFNITVNTGVIDNLLIFAKTLS